MERNERKLLSLVFIASLFLMFLEFVLIRVYSFITFPPLGFWVVATSTMGIGFGAAVAYILKKFYVVAFSLLFSISIYMIFIVVTQIPLVEPILSKIFIHSIILSFPFFSLSLIASYTFKLVQVNKVLFWSYLGSLLGTFLSFILIPLLGAENSLIFISLSFPFIVSLLEKNRSMIIGVIIAFILIFYIIDEMNIAKWLARSYPDQIYPKRIFTYLKNGWENTYTKWDMLMRVDVVRKNNTNFVLYDGSYEIGVNTTKLTLKPCLFRNYSNALIIGSGTGADVNLIKKTVGETYAVEISGVVVDIAKKMSRAYDDVIIEEMDGRKFIKRTNKNFDLIAFPLVDFPAATTNINAENYLTTVEGFEDFLSHLNENGTLCFAHHRRVLDDYLPSIIPALTKLGLNPEKSILVLEKERESCIEKLYGRSCENMIYLIAKKGKFTNSEIAEIKRLTEELDSGESKFWNWTELENYLKIHNLSPMTDDRPYIHSLSYFGRESEILAFSFIISTLFFMISFPWVKNLRLMFGSALTGFAYMLTETAIIQKSLILFPNPPFALAVVMLSFLLFNGIGAILSVRLRNRKNLLLFTPLSIVYFYCILSVLNTDLFHMNDYLMIGGFLLGILPVGILLGMLFPYILKNCIRKKRPLLYAVDAAFSTLGVSIALFISPYFGFKINFLISTFSYIILLIILR